MRTRCSRASARQSSGVPGAGFMSIVTRLFTYARPSSCPLLCPSRDERLRLLAAMQAVLVLAADVLHGQPEADRVLAEQVVERVAQRRVGAVRAQDALLELRALPQVRDPGRAVLRESQRIVPQVPD